MKDLILNSILRENSWITQSVWEILIFKGCVNDDNEEPFLSIHPVWSLKNTHSIFQHRLLFSVNPSHNQHPEQIFSTACILKTPKEKKKKKARRAPLNPTKWMRYYASTTLMITVSLSLQKAGHLPKLMPVIWHATTFTECFVTVSPPLAPPITHTTTKTLPHTHKHTPLAI